MEPNLLDRLQLTTNRLAINELKAVAPETAEIVENARFVDNGKIISSAGYLTGIDMSPIRRGKLLGEVLAENTALLIEYDWKI